MGTSREPLLRLLLCQSWRFLFKNFFWERQHKIFCSFHRLSHHSSLLSPSTDCRVSIFLSGWWECLPCALILSLVHFNDFLERGCSSVMSFYGMLQLPSTYSFVHGEKWSFEFYLHKSPEASHVVPTVIRLSFQLLIRHIRPIYYMSYQLSQTSFVSLILQASNQTANYLQLSYNFMYCFPSVNQSVYLNSMWILILQVYSVS